MNDLETLQYPIGKFQRPQFISDTQLQTSIKQIANFPSEVEQLISSCSPFDLTKTYRPGGWSINQLVHHCADSHMNTFIRFKLALTEDCPTIKPYFENLWAELPDTHKVDPSISLQIIKGVHYRWEVLLNSLTLNDFAKEYIHPELGERFTLAAVLSMYEWHCKHHLAHIKLAINS
ncbi:YfiT family bacillithiol transferase [Leeuwenhoekiella sp. W20_SRS_FM14]|uniref:YfiT family bacillithiol transferase n=1 Tax=Leeuwenhoekiella sp. W20_SRS_FM14 TaxID=3240270 RepID=UPI003F97B248